jgi:thiol-disulfide isomerase/thioredoxin
VGERSILPSLILGALVVVVALALILEGDAGAPPVIRGAVAPGFELPFLASADEGSEQPSSTLALSSLSGQVVLLNFWATWCKPCESEMPAMERLYGDLPKDGFELVAVAIDEKASDVESFQRRYQLSFPIVLDLDQEVYQAYQTMGVPESLLIDRDGRIVERYVGPREWDAPEYVERIRALLEDERRVPGDDAS